MIILQTAGGDDASGVAGFAGSLFGTDAGFQATTFRSNDYIHRLNRTLQTELRAVCAYQAVRPGVKAIDCDHAVEEHQYSARQIVRLVVANRGIPEDHAPLTTSLTTTVFRLCGALPTSMGQVATISALVTLEKSLFDSYSKLLDQAPPADAELLDLLAKRTGRRIEGLRGL